MRTEKPNSRFVPQFWRRKTNVISPQIFITDRSNAVGLLLFSVACFSVRASVTFQLIFVYIILVRFRLLNGHPLGKSCLLG